MADADEGFFTAYFAPPSFVAEKFSDSAIYSEAKHRSVPNADASFYN